MGDWSRDGVEPRGVVMHTAAECSVDVVHRGTDSTVENGAVANTAAEGLPGTQTEEWKGRTGSGALVEQPMVQRVQ